MSNDDPLLYWFREKPFPSSEIEQMFLNLAKQILLEAPLRAERRQAISKLLEARDAARRALPTIEEGTQTWNPAAGPKNPPKPENDFPVA